MEGLPKRQSRFCIQAIIWFRGLRYHAAHTAHDNEKKQRWLDKLNPRLWSLGSIPSTGTFLRLFNTTSCPLFFRLQIPFLIMSRCPDKVRDHKPTHNPYSFAVLFRCLLCPTTSHFPPSRKLLSPPLLTPKPFPVKLLQQNLSSYGESAVLWKYFFFPLPCFMFLLHCCSSKKNKNWFYFHKTFIINRALTYQWVSQLWCQWNITWGFELIKIA